MRALLALLLLAGCSSAPPEVTETSSSPLTPIVALVSGMSGDQANADAPHPVLTETVGGVTGPYVECYQNSECASDCCVTQNACESCAFGVSVCAPANVCR